MEQLIHGKLEYRNIDYFDLESWYVCKGTILFLTKLEFSNGYWWTKESLKYKAHTIPCLKLITN
jgi:hypothetical protein